MKIKRQLSREHRRKISQAHIGKHLSEEHKRKLSRNATRHWLGKHLSKKHKKNLSMALMGNKNTLGYKHTEEFKRKMSQRIKVEFYQKNGKRKYQKG